jgi:HK97 family phage portal protein
VLILEEGMKYNKNNISPEDAEMLDTEKSLYTRMASFFHVPPHKIGDMEHATFSNIEEQNIEYAVDTLRPWCVRIERAGKRQLLNESEKPRFFIKFLLDGLLRGDFESRMRGYAIGRNWGWFSSNDVLELEDRNGIGPQGDVYMAPQNMMPADQFNNSIPKPTRENTPAK